MRPRVHQSIFSAALGLGIAGLLRVGAAPVVAPVAMPAAVPTATPPAAADTAADSPFLPAKNSASAAAVSEGAPIELHGIMRLPDGMRFSIYDPAKKSATWVRLNERGSPFLVHDYNIVDGSDQVKIDYQGSTLTLGLKAAKIAAMSATPMTVAPGGGGPMGRGGNAITNSVVVNPTPADEAARLQAVVEAVAARRAARNQATQLQQAGGVPPQTVAPAGAGQTGPNPTNLRPRQIQRQQQAAQPQN
jgi:hypothetical protein